MKTIYETIPRDITGWKITVLGAGRSGLYVSLLLAKKGAAVVLSDSGNVKIEEILQKKIEFCKVKLDLGRHSNFIFEADLVVTSPGISDASPVIRKFQKRGINIVSEIEAAYWFSRKIDIIGITGSNGKTTTTSLIYELFKNSGYNAFCGGNIGKSFSEVVLEAETSDPANSIFILELSSFQLERIVHFKPKISLFLNISDDHMDRYENQPEKYLKAKLRIAMNQGKEDWYFYNSDDKILCQTIPSNCKSMAFGLSECTDIYFNDGKVYYQDMAVIHVDQLKLKGRHNLYNILAALHAAQIFHLPLEIIRKTLRDFAPVEHRLEYVATIKGVEYYNDSKATNVDSVRYALESFTKPLIVILGGKDKNSDFSELIPSLQAHCKLAILMGAATEKLQKILTGTLPLIQADSMDNAVKIATKSALKGDIVLLSPACASFDMFDNFEHRGRVFKNCVLKLIAHHDD
ncbi:MAG: UDP-N-acetylmuramoyl-L-alanine--D-glutamate ligase [Candidatus Marinimicrobia bacterium]|nr:UDP-N-acetylmuramoyl-L-alanine--D-glutamate ligase [Candidatus Neomarinimicrobiota bacterium]